MHRAVVGVLLVTGCADPALERRVEKLEKESKALRAEVTDLRGRLMTKRDEQEQAIVGNEAKLQAVSWVQGEASLDEAPATLFVFWELWCPHCKKEIPQLEERYQTYREKGLNVVGVTRLTRDTKPEAMRKFLGEKGVTYPIAQDDGTMSEHYAVTGVPAASLVKDGKIVWRGHPSKLSDAMLDATVAK